MIGEMPRCQHAREFGKHQPARSVGGVPTSHPVSWFDGSCSGSRQRPGSAVLAHTNGKQVQHRAGPHHTTGSLNLLTPCSLKPERLQRSQANSPVREQDFFQRNFFFGTLRRCAGPAGQQCGDVEIRGISSCLVFDLSHDRFGSTSYQNTGVCVFVTTNTGSPVFMALFFVLYVRCVCFITEGPITKLFAHGTFFWSLRECCQYSTRPPRSRHAYASVQKLLTYKNGAAGRVEPGHAGTTRPSSDDGALLLDHLELRRALCVREWGLGGRGLQLVAAAELVGAGFRRGSNRTSRLWQSRTRARGDVALRACFPLVAPRDVSTAQAPPGRHDQVWSSDDGVRRGTGPWAAAARARRSLARTCPCPHPRGDYTGLWESAWHARACENRWEPEHAAGADVCHAAPFPRPCAGQ